MEVYEQSLPRAALHSLGGPKMLGKKTNARSQRSSRRNCWQAPCEDVLTGRRSDPSYLDSQISAFDSVASEALAQPLGCAEGWVDATCEHTDGY
jgi:hypothetical protein